MTIRSTTDEMLAARHDPEPYAGADGRRYASPFDMAVGAFDPRVECIPSRDPNPWTCVGRLYLRSATGREWPGAYRIWNPRPAYARPEPNPILVAFRELFGEIEGETLAVAAEVEILLIDAGDWADEATPAEIEDARKVLTHLAGSES